MATLTLRRIKKRYGPVETLKGIDLDLEDGEFLVLLGSSGCGKSTLLNIIAGLIEPSDGDVLIDGQSIVRVHPKNRNIAMVFQSYALYPNMTVARNLGFGLEMRGVAKAERQQAIEKVASVLQIDHLLDRKPAALSGGQRQRVAIGRAMVRDPKVFLFDEPLSNLDAKLRVEMRTELKKLHQRLGTTIVYVTHDQIEAMTLASRIAIMRDGVVQQFATPQEIYERPANLYIADFIGSPGMNFIHGELRRQDGRIGVMSKAGATGASFLPLAATGAAAVEAQIDRPVILGIRPETVTLADGGTESVPHLASFEAQVEVLEPTGADTLGTLRLGGDQITARLRPGDLQRAGGTARFAADMSRASLFDPETGLRIS
ncbi:ABC transporter ATP-binding protein [Dongia soli]|uniref:ABC transporter ATP-binding protein n=1 Tax=Dongia soli TaxID=600628 RepID=A0ABU5E708_9PROT|nr:ABC transporter ATP-binding protein [Dongia soli]MDY0882075.1 ABC transporter ATP-binding protein [Dongia soli]